METKQCSACKQTLTIDNFSKSGRSANNYKGKSSVVRYSSRCKPCTSEYAREWRRKNPQYDKTRDRNSRESDTEKLLRSMLKARVGEAKTRARKYNKAFDINYEYVRDIYTGYCAISKTELLVEKGSLDVPSLDCIDPSKGYVRGNVQWLTWRINRAKGEQSQSDFISMCKAVLEGATTIP